MGRLTLPLVVTMVVADVSDRVGFLLGSRERAQRYAARLVGTGARWP